MKSTAEAVVPSEHLTETLMALLPPLGAGLADAVQFEFSPPLVVVVFVVVVVVVGTTHAPFSQDRADAVQQDALAQDCPTVAQNGISIELQNGGVGVGLAPREIGPATFPLQAATADFFESLHAFLQRLPAAFFGQALSQR